VHTPLTTPAADPANGPAVPPLPAEETVVADARAGLSPSQLVEQKLLAALKAHPVLASQFHRRLRPGPR
jgi:hypothetical protein